MISKKIILTGSFGVGKTSLFNKFLYNKFSEKYMTTIGVKVDKKTVHVEDQQVSLLLWDIAGEVSQDKVPHSYFLGASGVIYVFDLTRPSTFLNIKEDINYLSELLPGVSMKIVGNKLDLISDSQLEHIKSELTVPYDIVTSAKKGEHVEELFTSMASALLTKTTSSI